MQEKVEVNIMIREEEMDGKKVFIINNEETGVSDFGDSLEEATENFKKSLAMYLETYPEKRTLLIKEYENKPLMVSRILI